MRGVSEPRLRRLAVGMLLILAVGCQGEPQTGSGPGRRPQELALTPEQELALGRQAFAEIKRRFRTVETGRWHDQVQRVGQRVLKAAEIKPLQREINLRLQGYRFEWEFEVFEHDQVNAFCLPAGKVGVFTGLLKQLGPSDDQLAAVISHEVAHALAHHASERLARYDLLAEAADGLQANALSRDVMGVLIPALRLGDLAHDRQQESEADHIGVFLMAFANYDPRQAVAFWERMERTATGRGQPPEILSNHPSNARRIAQLREWAPMALGAKKAYDEGNVVQ
jgi:predicted Zn-dependent protease